MPAPNVSDVEGSPNRLNGDRTTALYRIVVLSLILLNAVMNYITIGGECVDKSTNPQANAEVTLTVDGVDVARAALFRASLDKFDVLVAVQNTGLVRTYAEMLRGFAFYIETGRNWESSVELPSVDTPSNETSTIPF